MNKQHSSSACNDTEEVIFFQTSLQELTSRPTLLCLSGLQAGMLLPIHAIEQPFLIGRDGDTCHLFIDSPEISRHHAVIEMREDNQLYVVDRDSTNGVFVDQRKTKCHRLQVNDKIRFGPHSVWKFFYQDIEEYKYYQQLYSHASEDHLTGALNRRSFFRLLERELAFAKRHNRIVSVTLCDIDHFKAVNDTYGHLAGDQVLKEFVSRIQSASRQEDILARYGGEEFVMLLREIEPSDGLTLVERLRSLIASTPFQTSAGEIKVTASFGLITCPSGSLADRTPHDLLHEADTLLYQAKETGRNRVCTNL